MDQLIEYRELIKKDLESISNYDYLKEELENLRKEKNLTQQELADKIFVSRSAVAKWEQNRGLPSKELLESLSKIFNISEEELYHWKNKKITPKHIVRYYSWCYIIPTPIIYHQEKEYGAYLKD